MGGPAEPAFVETVTRAALRLLFEREGAARVRFPGGAVVMRAEYLAAAGLE